MSDEPILTPMERQMLKSAAIQEYAKVWGVPKHQEMIVVCRVIDVMSQLMGEAGRLDA